MSGTQRLARRLTTWLTCLAAAQAVGCVASQGSIQSADPSERIRAIRVAAAAKDAQAVPLIVDRLEDEDDAVRFFAILALEAITGERFGYDYAAAASRRAAAVEVWRDYVRRGGHVAGG